MKATMLRAALGLGLVLSASGCDARSRADAEPARETLPLLDEKRQFFPLPPRASLGLDTRRVALGRKLFDDPILSGDQTVSCVSCHLRDKGLSNGTQVATTPTRAAGKVNVPTLYNVVYNYYLNWNGQFQSLEDQLDALIEKPGAMGASWKVLVPRLKAHPEYDLAFRDAYPGEGVTAKTLPNALIEYMKSLTTPNSKFDRSEMGDKSALNREEHEGYLLFKSYGCSACHQGRNVGGNMLQTFGVMGNYFAEERGGVETLEDLGHFNVTSDPEDRYKFRVPSLRNVELTAPYFHDGRAATLDEAVRLMGKYQLGRPIEPAERTLLVAFLKTLTGDMNDEALK